MILIANFAEYTNTMADSAHPFSFKKEEKLCSRKLIEDLFLHGKSIYFQNFKIIYRIIDSNDAPVVKVLISIPKKYTKLAINRNSMKRLIRESYRVNKEPLIDKIIELKKECNLAFIYNGKYIVDYSTTSIAIKTLLNRLKQANEENSR